MKAKPLFDLLKAATYKGEPLMSLAAFARRHRTTPQTVYRWQSGVRDIPPDVMVDLLAFLTEFGVIKKSRVEDVMLTPAERQDVKNTVAMLRKVIDDRIKKEKKDGKPTPRRQRQGRGTGTPGGKGVSTV